MLLPHTLRIPFPLFQLYLWYRFDSPQSLEMESLCGDRFYLLIFHVYSKFVPTNSCQFHVNSHQDTPLQLMKLDSCLILVLYIDWICLAHCATLYLEDSFIISTGFHIVCAIVTQSFLYQLKVDINKAVNVSQCRCTLCYTRREVWLRLPRANATQTQAVQSNYSYFFLFTTKIVTAARQPHFLVPFSWYNLCFYLLLLGIVRVDNIANSDDRGSKIIYIQLIYTMMSKFCELFVSTMNQLMCCLENELNIYISHIHSLSLRLSFNYLSYANKMPPIANLNFYSYKILQFNPSSFLCFQL